MVGLAHDRRDALSQPWRDAGGAALAGAGAAACCMGFYALNRGFFLVDDGQTASLPYLLAMGRGWLQGAPAALSASWYAGETPVGPWSPALAGVAAGALLAGASLNGAAAAFAAFHEGVLAAGCYALARRLGLPAHAAALAAVVGAFNGYAFVWGARDWINDLACFAWLPWLWWALLRPGPALPAATLGGLAIALMAHDVWPFTLVTAAALTAALAARALHAERRPAALGRYVGAWAIGLGLGAPTLLPWLDLVGGSHRAATGLVADATWQVPLAALPGLVLPAIHAEWQIFAGAARKPAHELAGGLVPVAALLAAALGGWRAAMRGHGVALAMLALFAALALLPGFWNFRWPFRGLPMAHLALALAGAAAIAAAPRRGAIGPGAIALALVAATWAGAALLAGDGSPLLWATGVAYALLAAGGGAPERGGPGHPPAPRAAPRRAPGAPALVAAGTLGATYLLLPLERPAQGKWRVEEAVRAPAPFDPARTYLLLATPVEQLEAAQRGWPLTAMRIGNLPMLAGLRTLNGYTNAGPPGLERIFAMRHAGTVAPRAADHMIAHELGPDGWLRRLGVDGVAVGPARMAGGPPPGWVRAYEGPDGAIWHRLGPPAPPFQAIRAARTAPSTVAAADAVYAHRAGPFPATLVAPAAPAGQPRAYADAALAAMDAATPQALGADVRVGAGAPALVAVSRAYYRGWRAWLGDRELPTHALDGVQLAVELPAGAVGRLEIRYRPRSFDLGLALAALTAILLALAWWRRRPEAETPAG